MIISPEVQSFAEERMRDSTFTPKEHEVAGYLLLGLSNGEIAHEMGCGVSWVRDCLVHMYAKAGCANRVQLVLYLTGAME